MDNFIPVFKMPITTIDLFSPYVTALGNSSFYFALKSSFLYVKTTVNRFFSLNVDYYNSRKKLLPKLSG